MTIYVDDMAIKRYNRTWYHLMSDASFDELHDFAKRLGLQRSWFQGDHYDLTQSKRNMAIRLGATECDAYEMLKIRKSFRS